MKLPEVIDKYLTNEDIKEVLSALKLERSGSRPELIEQLLKAVEGMSARKVVTYFPGNALVRICKDNGIETRSVLGLFSDTDDEMVKKICAKVLDKEAPKLDGHSIKIFELVKDNITRDQLQSILESLKLPVSGNKEDLLVRLLQSSSKWNVEDVLSLFSIEVLKAISISIGLTPKKAKRDMIEGIAQKEFGIAPKERKVEIDKAKHAIVASSEEPITPHKKSKRLVSGEPERAIGDQEILLYQILDEDVNKEDIKSALSKLDEPISGSKDELIERLLEAVDYDPRALLSSLDGYSLSDIANRHDIKKRRSKEDQIEEILNNYFDTEEFNPSPSINQEKAFLQGDSNREGYSIQIELKNKFNEVTDYIDRWVPSESWPEEGGYRTDLYHYLRNKYIRVSIEKGESRIDLLVDDKIPIEVKLAPDQKEYQRAFDQAYRHMERYGLLIEVICRPKVQSQLHEFEERVQRMASPHNYLFKVIIK